jgi:hypothetical protein
MADWFSLGLAAMTFLLLKAAGAMLYLYADEFYMNAMPFPWKLIAVSMAVCGVAVLLATVFAPTAYAAIGQVVMAVAAVGLAGSFWLLYRDTEGDVL